MQPDTDGGVLDEYVDIEFWDKLEKNIKKDNEVDIKDMENQIHELNKFYRKHAFDDDQTICKGYHEIITNLKEKIKELRGKAK
jgi:hypothetical protein